MKNALTNGDVLDTIILTMAEEEAFVAILHLWLEGIYIAIFPNSKSYFWLCLCLMNSKLNSFCFHDDNIF